MQDPGEDKYMATTMAYNLEHESEIKKISKSIA
jgi:hypothetical protein